MRVVVATEGDLELRVLRCILKQVRARNQTVQAEILKLTCQPDGPARHIARKARPLLLIAESKLAVKFILVLDRETRAELPGVIAAEIADEIRRTGDWRVQVEVVIKDRMVENWLIADLAALRRLRNRFKVSKKLQQAVEPNKADRIDALSLLKRAVIGHSYDKMDDGARISNELDILRAASNSRSLRHLLHVLECPPYELRCASPAQVAVLKKARR